MSNLGLNLSDFISRLDSLRNIYPILPAFIENSLKKIGETTTKIIDEHAFDLQTKKTKKGESKTFRLDGQWGKLFDEELKKASGFNKAIEIIPQSMIISIVSQFDGFIGNLIKILVTEKEEILNSIQKEIKLSEINKFNSIEDAKTYLIDKEIESVLRDSHSEQFKWFENKLNVKLNVDLEIWPDFIELTERRNLFTHTRGIVSEQYIKNCCDHNFQLPKEIEKGKKLTADKNYFFKSIDILIEISAKLTYVIWNKLIHEENDQINSHLNELFLPYIQEERFSLCENMFKFGQKYLSKLGKESYLIHNLNLAQVYLWKNEEERCLSIVNNFDWDIYDLKYRLASKVLQRKFTDAVNMMDDIKQSKALEPNAYKEWPIFKEFIKNELFLTKFKELYKEEFLTNEYNS